MRVAPDVGVGRKRAGGAPALRLLRLTQSAGRQQNHAGGHDPEYERKTEGRGSRIRRFTDERRTRSGAHQPEPNSDVPQREQALAILRFRAQLAPGAWCGMMKQVVAVKKPIAGPL